MHEAAKKQEIERLEHAERIALIERPTDTSFVCVHSFDTARNGFHRFSFLQPLHEKDNFLSRRSWDMYNDDFTPTVQCEGAFVHGKCEGKVYYLEHGNNSGAEALVRTRYYWGTLPAEIEIAEEFRLFWNLVHICDKSRNILLHCDKDGTEHEVVRIKGSRVDVQLRFLVEYLRAKQMHLALQLEGAYWSNYSLEELSLSPRNREKKGDLFHWWFNLSSTTSVPDFRSMALLTGKVIIPCPGEVQYKNPYESDDTTQPAFIVAQDSSGQPTTDAWDEKKGHANALTPVFFKRAVLGRYFAEPERYEVGDGDLRCSRFWSLRMDNDHPLHIIVWLKDLGQGLPKAERDHWRKYNILPDGTYSKTFYTRNIRARFADSEMPDLRLKQLYPWVNDCWTKQYGWPLWREAEPEDRYVVRQVHVCLDENQAEFDQQNGLLAKLVVDFQNASKITETLKTQEPPEGSLNRFQLFLTDEGFAEAKQQIRPLRIVQDLRSTGAAHGKGTKYKEVLKHSGLEGLSLVDASVKVFQGAVNFVEWLQTK